VAARFQHPRSSQVVHFEKLIVAEGLGESGDVKDLIHPARGGSERLSIVEVAAQHFDVCASPASRVADQNSHRVTFGMERVGQVAADESGGPGDEDPFSSTLCGAHRAE
jgi:hypothetical protein